MHEVYLLTKLLYSSGRVCKQEPEILALMPFLCWSGILRAAHCRMPAAFCEFRHIHEW